MALKEITDSIGKKCDKIFTKAIKAKYGFGPWDDSDSDLEEKTGAGPNMNKNHGYTTGVTNGLNSVRPNPSGRLVCLSVDQGIRVFRTDPLCLISKLTTKDVGSVQFAEIAQESNILAYTGCPVKPNSKQDDTEVTVIDRNSKYVYVNYWTDEPVLSLRHCGDWLLIVTAKKIFLRYLMDLWDHDYITLSTENNYLGLCETSESGLIVFPASTVGHIQIVNTKNLTTKSTVAPVLLAAHNSKIACLGLSQSGSLIATGSEKGTLIRIFDSSTKQKLMELRRGMDTAHVYSIAFSPLDDLLSVCSDKGTVHIFALKDAKSSSVFKPVSNFLPTLDAQKSFAQFKIPAECASILFFKNSQNIIAISMDGWYYMYGITRQGECKKKIVCYLLDLGADFFD